VKKTFFVLAMLLISSIALAEIPNYITVQGKLTDANDLPVASGSYLFNFTVYNSPIIGSGNLIWTEQFTVTITNGLFNTALNPPSDVAFDEPYFLEVRVGTTSTNLKLLQPRVNITSAGYAFVSAGISGDLDMKGKSIENVWRVRNPSGQDLWIGLTDATKSIGFYDYTNSWNVFRYNGAFGERDVDFYRNLSMNGNYVCLANGCRSDWPTSTSNGWSVGTYVTNSTVNARVGIGIASPLQVLDVRGNIHIGGTANAAKYLRFATYITSEEFTARHYIGVESTGFNIVADDAPPYSNINFRSFTGSAITTKMKIDATTGNVGIGAIAPDEKLHVNDSASTYMKVQSGATQISGVKLQRGTTSDAYTDYNIYDSGGNLYVDRSNAGSATARMFISDSTGNVGIGKTNPAYTLDVNGVVNATGFRTRSQTCPGGWTCDLNTWDIVAQSEKLYGSLLLGNTTSVIPYGDSGISYYAAGDALSLSNGGDNGYFADDGTVTIGNTGGTKPVLIRGSGLYLKNSDLIIQSRDSVAQREAQMYNDLGNLRIRSDYNADNDKAGSITLEASSINVNGNVPSGIQINSGWTMNPTCDASHAGQLKYWKFCSGGGSTAWTAYLQICMQTGETTYAWYTIRSNSWIGLACI